jgi:F-type H+-transporting ATPase subunit delta
MTDAATLARPYAHAIFDSAVTAGTTQAWSDVLRTLAVVMQDDAMQSLLADPGVPNATLKSLVQDIMAQANASATDQVQGALCRTLDVLLEHERLACLPAISEAYRALLSAYEDAVRAIIVSATPLSEAQHQTLEKRLATRLGKKIVLNSKVDPKLVGGAVIKVGHWVLDGSVTNQIKQLKTCLATLE